MGRQRARSLDELAEKLVSMERFPNDNYNDIDFNGIFIAGDYDKNGFFDYHMYYRAKFIVGKSGFGGYRLLVDVGPKSKRKENIFRFFFNNKGEWKKGDDRKISDYLLRGPYVEIEAIPHKGSIIPEGKVITPVKVRLYVPKRKQWNLYPRKINPS